MKIATQKGFTLIEVLIAMTVFAVGILAVMSMITTAIGGNAKAVAITDATMLSSDVMEEIMALPYDSTDLDAGSHTGSSAGYTVTWDVSVDDPISNVKQIDLAITSTMGVATTSRLTFYKMDK